MSTDVSGTSREEVAKTFANSVWSALEADANDLRKQQRIVKAFQAAFSDRERAFVQVDVMREALARIAAARRSDPDSPQRVAKEALHVAALTPSLQTGGEGEIVPPPNGETDPEWAAIKRAIDQFAGRKPVISKHRAVHNSHLAAVVDRLDAAGDREAADTIVWQCWYRALDRERERFLLSDALSPAPSALSVPEEEQ